MFYLLNVLGWQVDQAILSEEDRVVIIRFGRDYVSSPFCDSSFFNQVSCFVGHGMYANGRVTLRNC